MIEIKSELISDGDDDDEEEEEEEEIVDDESATFKDESVHFVQPRPAQSNVTYIIAHGPNGLLTIPIQRWSKFSSNLSKIQRRSINSKFSSN